MSTSEQNIVRLLKESIQRQKELRKNNISGMQLEVVESTIKIGIEWLTENNLYGKYFK